jgi:hypothetical protein
MPKKKREATWRNAGDNPPNVYHFIDHLDPQKRMRVWENQQMDDVIESLKPSNYLTEFVRYMKGCDNLSRCYPIHEELGHIDEIRREFWAKYQYKVKTVIKPMIRKIYRAEAKEDLKRMGFL